LFFSSNCSSDKDNVDTTSTSKIKSKGYSEYNNYFPIGIMDSLNFEIFENKINNIINNLNDGEILTIIPTLLYKDEDSIQRGLSLKSTKLSNKTNLNHLFDLIEHSLIKLANEYTLELPEAFLILKWKKMNNWKRIWI